MNNYAESPFENAVLSYFHEIGYTILHGPDLGPQGDTLERSTWTEVLLLGRVRDAITRLNPGVPPEAVEAAVAVIRRFDAANPAKEAERRYFLLRDGVPVEVETGPGERRTIPVRLMDLSTGGQVNNDFLVLNQVRVVDGGKTRRADIVVFINGIPVGVFELKSPTDPNATISGAYNQLVAYRDEIPALMAWAQVLVVADGASARVGTITSALEHYSRWRTIASETPEPDDASQVKVLVHGLFAPERICEVLARFIDWAETKTGPKARLARYNQYWGVKAAHASIKVAAAPGGDRKAGIVFHGQGSGKSMELLLLANMVARDPDLGNPTFVALSDRSDLDDQLFTEEFGPTRILPETAVKARSGDHLGEVLARPAGGIIVTTIQKFEHLPEGALTTRSNVILGTDEAHRTQYGLLDGVARDVRNALPNATFIAFTGTPIATEDRNTVSVFGPSISRYTPRQSVEDEATVPIYYVSRVASIRYTDEASDALEEAVRKATDTASDEEQQAVFAHWANVRSILSSDPVVKRIAEDVVAHWEERRQTIAGKAMVALASREAAVKFYDEVARLRPDWVSDDEKQGRVKVVYTGSAADPEHLRRHVRTPDALDDMKRRAQDERDPLDLIVVVDLWLTGFNAPALTTLYLAKPLKGHTLFQAITRPNRVWRDKPAGLVVGYVPLLDAINDAVATYGETGAIGQVGVSLDEAVKALRRQHDIVTKILHGHEWTSAPAPEKVQHERATAAAHFIFADDDRRKRYMDQSLALAKVFAIAGATDEGARLRDNVEFLLAVRGTVSKLSGADSLAKPSNERLESVISTLVAGSIEADRIIDIYAETGAAQPEISLLTDEFLASIGKDARRNVQVELLRKILADGIKAIERRNIVQGRTLSDILSGVISRYHNKTLSDAEIVAALVDLAKRVRDEDNRVTRSGLSVSELAFYDALAMNGSAVEILGDDELRLIAQEVARKVRDNTTLDWRDRESVRARLRLIVKTVLKNHKYPPDKREAAADLVLEQAHLFSEAMFA